MNPKRKKSRNESKYKFYRDIVALKKIVSKIHQDGNWEYKNDYYQYKIMGKTCISFYPDTWTIMFQGKPEAKINLEHAVMKRAIQSNATKKVKVRIFHPKRGVSTKIKDKPLKCQEVKSHVYK